MEAKTYKVLEYDKIVKMLVEKAESQLGKNMAKNIKASSDIEEVEYMQRETQEALRLFIDKGTPPLYGIYDISHELKMAEIGGVLSPGSLLKISDSLRVSRNLKRYIKEVREQGKLDCPIVQGGLIEDLRTFKTIEEEINNAIVGEDEISDNASGGALRSIRRQIMNKNDSIKDKLNSITNSNKYKKYLQDSIVTVRDGRYVVPIKQEYKSYFPGIVHDQSSSGATLFVEPMAVVELNNELRELEIKEKEEIEKILRKLSNLVAEEASSIKKTTKKNTSKIGFYIC